MDSNNKSNEKKIYVSNIPKHVDSKQLQRYFEAFGSVYSAVVIGAKKGKSLSYGFVSFSSKKSLEKVLAATHVLDGSQLCIDTVSVEKAKHNLIKYANGEDANVFLFVQDIPKDVNKTVLVDHFAKFGRLTKARLVERPDKNKDFMYLQYESIDSAATVKSQKHRISGLSQESITIVCKVGIFRNQKQIQVMEEAEDLLLAHRGTSFSLGLVSPPDEDPRCTRETILRATTTVLPLDDTHDFGRSAAITQADALKSPVLTLPTCASPILAEGGATGREPLFRKCTLEEQEDNYRFNRSLVPYQPRAKSPQDGRVRASKHVTISDVAKLTLEGLTGLEGVGAIGSERKTGASPQNKPDKPFKGTFSGLGSALKYLGSSFLTPFNSLRGTVATPNAH